MCHRGPAKRPRTKGATRVECRSIPQLAMPASFGDRVMVDLERPRSGLPKSGSERPARRGYRRLTAGSVAAKKSWSLVVLTGIFCFWASSSVPAEPAAPLVLERTIALKGVAGRIDHMAVDLERKRLFVAELGNGTLDAIDLAAGVGDPPHWWPQGAARCRLCAAGRCACGCECRRRVGALVPWCGAFAGRRRRSWR